ncbi:hypothetical protein Gogos_005500 [Gossypium gossypioides]|uniref:Uncharacterized protein n=1 Tax=Gossypium gossypioides TaxID=34282 RepID=A0A7J9D0K0_GOSGO|nr:hypothetical protein [Gossypium gossypioides]
MPPRKSKKTTVQETSIVPDPAKFENLNTEKYFLKLQARPFIQERRFKPSMCRNLILPSETKKYEKDNWDTVTVKGEEETGPVHQEFVRMNGLRAPNYPPDMFGSAPTYHDGGGDNAEAGTKNENEGMRKILHELRMSGSTDQKYGLGKGKAPIEQRHAPPLDDSEED